MSGACKHGAEPSRYIRGREFLDLPSDFQVSDGVWSKSIIRKVLVSYVFH